MSNFLQLHGLQHARYPCSSLSPGVCSNSCPLSWWCHPTISSSIASFSSYLNISHIRVFSSESALRIRWPKYRRLSFSISPYSEYSGLIFFFFFRIDWFDLLELGLGELKSIYRSRSKDRWWHRSWGESAVPYKASPSGEAIAGSSGRRVFNFSFESGRAASTGKDSSKFRSAVSSYVPIPLFRILFVLHQCLPLTADTLWGWEFNLCCNLATHMLRLWVWFSVSSAALEANLFSGQTEKFSGHSCYAWSGKSNPWAHPFLSPLCPVQLGATRQSYYTCKFDKVSKYQIQDHPEPHLL